MIRDRKPLSLSEIEDMSADARNALNTKVVWRIFDDMELNYINRLKAANVGDLSATDAHASLRVLEDVKAQLELYANRRIK
jgi:hypothetical protein